jgi:hypothetical protein
VCVGGCGCVRLHVRGRACECVRVREWHCVCARARVCVCVGVTFLRDPLPQYSIIIMYLKRKAVVLKVLRVLRVLRVHRVLQPRSALRDIACALRTQMGTAAPCALRRPAAACLCLRVRVLGSMEWVSLDVCVCARGRGGGRYGVPLEDAARSMTMFGCRSFEISACVR